MATVRKGDFELRVDALGVVDAVLAELRLARDVERAIAPAVNHGKTLRERSTSGDASEARVSVGS